MTQLEMFDKDDFVDPRHWEHINPKGYYTAKEVAEMFGCNRQTIYNYIFTGQLKHIWVGGYRIPGWSIIEYLKENATKE